jgi:hypothetical protein
MDEWVWEHLEPWTRSGWTCQPDHSSAWSKARPVAGLVNHRSVSGRTAVAGEGFDWLRLAYAAGAVLACSSLRRASGGQRNSPSPKRPTGRHSLTLTHRSSTSVITASESVVRNALRPRDCRYSNQWGRPGKAVWLGRMMCS